MSGLRYWDIDPNIESNKEYFADADGSKFGRGTLQELQELGFELKAVTFNSASDLIDAVNRYRLTPMSGESE
jgi:hypothetical protein